MMFGKKGPFENKKAWRLFGPIFRSNQMFYCHLPAWGVLMASGATLNACHHSEPQCSQCLPKLLPKPVTRKARKALGASLCFAFSAKIRCCFDKSAATAASTLTSLAAATV